jgi:hypothetical protein
MGLEEFFGEFPDRPESAEFWKLSDIVHYLDGQATEGGKSPSQIVEEADNPVPGEVVTYIAKHRTARALTQILNLTEEHAFDHPFLSILAACWVDGFATGQRWSSEST